MDVSLECDLLTNRRMSMIGLETRLTDQANCAIFCFIFLICWLGELAHRYRSSTSFQLFIGFPHFQDSIARNSRHNSFNLDCHKYNLMNKILLNPIKYLIKIPSVSNRFQWVFSYLSEVLTLGLRPQSGRGICESYNK